MLTVNPKVPGNSWFFSEGFSIGLTIHLVKNEVKNKPCLDNLYEELEKSLTYFTYMDGR
jgi:hypothetical protein